MSRRFAAFRSRFSPTGLLIALWVIAVQFRSLLIWFDWETVRFFVQPRPGRIRWLEVFYGGYIDLSDYGIRAASQTFRPLMATMFHIEALLFGGREWLWHSVNLAFHLACVYLLIRCARSMGLDARASSLAGLLFGVHPLVTQPLWILLDRAEQAVLLTGLIVLLTHTRSLFVSSLALLAGLLSKETAVTIPLWIVLWDLLESGFRRFRSWLVYGCLTAVYVGYRAWIFHGMGGYRSVEHFRVGDLAETIAQNLSWLLTVPHPFPGGVCIAAGLLVLALIPAMPRGYRFGVLWSALFLMPVHNLCNKWYLYTPVAGMSLALASLVAALYRRHPATGRIARGFALGLAILFSLQSIAELDHQKRNADVPRQLAVAAQACVPDPKPDATFRFILRIAQDELPLRGHWFDPGSFQIKAQKSPLESIVWDLNATRYLQSGRPVWTRSVEAALRYRYDSLRLTAVLVTDVEPGTRSDDSAIDLVYAPASPPLLERSSHAHHPD